MAWFRREPPPPPPPKSSLGLVLQISIPIIFAIIMGLAGFSFNGYKSYAASERTTNKEAIEKLQDQKVDNKTMQLMIELQKQQSANQKEDINDLQKNVDKLQQNIETILQLLQEQNK